MQVTGNQSQQISVQNQTLSNLQPKKIIKECAKIGLAILGFIIGFAATSAVGICSIGFVFILCPNLKTESWALNLGKWAYKYLET